MWHLVLKSVEVLIIPLGIGISYLIGIFLFWRSSRYELVDPQDVFDVVLLFTSGALLLGRIGDFIIRFDFYKWSLTRLFFFNAFGGFDYYFAFLGGVLAVWWYLKNSRENFWFVFDLAAAPIVFSVSLYFAAVYLVKLIANKSIFTDWKLFLIFLCYFILFWIIKRLEKRKSHKGFFACFAIFGSFLIGLLGYFILPSSKLIGGRFLYQPVVEILILTSVLPAWYILAKRKIWVDIKAFFAHILLTLFKTKRVLFSVGEANTVAKNILLSPYLLVKAAYFLVKLLCREIVGGLFDFMHALGVKG